MLTEAQREVFDAVVFLAAKERKSPTASPESIVRLYKQIGDKLGLKSLSTVHKHINTLIRKGFLLRPSPYELQIVPAAARNEREWQTCDKGHPRIMFQVANCPICIVREVSI
jgi:SOS-response transcriptional repressor LexA